MRNELNDFVSAVGKAGSLIEARALLTTDAHGAALALASEA